MKNIHLYIALATAALLVGCNDGYDPAGTIRPSLTARFLHAGETTFDSPAPDAFSCEFSIESLNTPWKFGDVASWFTLTPAQGSSTSTITLSAEENKSADEARTAIFYLQSAVSDWSFNQALSVSQGKAVPTVTVDQSEFSLPGTGGSGTVTVTANCTWEATCSDSWITVQQDAAAGTFSFSATPNPDNSYRTTYIYVNYDGGYAYVTVKQAPSEITASETTLTFSNEASRYEISVTAEVDWTAVASDSWISVTPSEGTAGTTKVVIEAAPNSTVYSRYGYVTFNSGTYTKLQIELSQSGLSLSADDTLVFTSASSTQKLNIASNTSWSVLNAPTWVSISPASGEGNAAIDVTVADNPSVASRKGTITLGQPGIDLSYDVTVSQSGKYFETNATLLEFDDKGGIRTFEIKTDANWTSALSGDWFSATPASGKGNTTISVSATENNSTEERSGIIRYDFADESTSVNIHQLAKYLTIDNTTFEFSSKGGSHVVEFLTNDSWTATVAHDVEWLTLSQTSGEGSAKITITAADNPSVNVRSTSVIITPKNAQAVQILVTQRPRTLELSTRSVVFFAKGGTSDPVEVTTDGTFKVTSEGDWFSVNGPTGNTFTVTAAPNGEKEPRRGTLTVTLTDLAEGSLSVTIPVIQAGEGCSFVIDTYPDTDTNWLPVGGGSLTIQVTGYAADQNWDSKWASDFKVTVTGYSADQDWNRTNTSACHATVTVYGAEKNWNPALGSSGSFAGSSYGNDSEWNTSAGSAGTITSTSYGSDSNWNN